MGEGIERPARDAEGVHHEEGRFFKGDGGARFRRGLPEPAFFPGHAEGRFFRGGAGKTFGQKPRRTQHETGGDPGADRFGFQEPVQFRRRLGAKAQGGEEQQQQYAGMFHAHINRWFRWKNRL